MFQTERDSTYAYPLLDLDVKRTALILIDVWKSHPNKGWLARAAENIENKLVPLLHLSRSRNLKIVHCPHSNEIAEAVRPRANEFVVDADSGSEADWTNALHDHLQENGIKTLLYAGYASNWCLLHRPTGIIAMNKLKYEIILVRDCTIAFETPETLDGEWANKVTINTVEYQWGATTMLKDLEAAFKESK